MKKGYALHPGVLQDLREIHAYIAQDSLDAADQVFDDIMAVGRTAAQRIRQRLRMIMKPATESLCAGTLADLARTKPVLIAENALLRQ